jgi:hypothetical protein
MGTCTDASSLARTREWRHTTQEVLMQLADLGTHATKATEHKGIIMDAPFIFIGTYRLQAGKAEGFKQYLESEKFFEYIGANEPRLLAFNGYINEEDTEVTFVQVHPDASSMEFHMQVAHAHIGRAYEEFLDPAGSSIQVYGQPSDAVLGMTRQFAGSGVPLNVKSEPLGGFTRLEAAGSRA